MNVWDFFCLITNIQIRVPAEESGNGLITSRAQYQYRQDVEFKRQGSSAFILVFAKEFLDFIGTLRASAFW